MVRHWLLLGAWPGEQLTQLARAFLVGLVIAATPGPIFFLCLDRTLRRGWWYGVASGLGIAAADAAYAGVAAIGLAAAEAFIAGTRDWLLAAAGGFLLVIAWRTVRRGSPPAAAQPAVPRALLLAFATMLGLTLANPLTVLSFAALFTGAGLSPPATLPALMVVGGVFLGSAAWWLGLVSAATRSRTTLTPRAIRLLNRVAGCVVGAFGFYTLFALLASLLTRR